MALNRLKFLVLNKTHAGLLIGVVMLLAFTGGGAAADESLVASLNTALSQPSKNKSKVSAVVLDVHTGETLYANRYANDGFIPASNMKLVTSAVALHTYGPEAKFTTTLAVAGDDLLVIGTGDPAFGDAKLAEREGRTPMSVLDDWAMALRNAGIVKIKGDLVVIDTVFDDKLVHPSWSSNNRLQWYGAPVAGVSFNSNCVDFTFVPTSPGKSATILTVPAEGGFVVQGSVKTAGKDGKHNPVLGKRPAPEKGMSVYTVRGNLKQRSGPHPKPVDDPRLFLGEVLKAHLARHGIEIAGHVRLEERVTSEMAQRSRVIATHQTPLPDILGRVNTDSQNMMAEALAKLNGWAYELRQGNLRDRGTWIGGHAAAVAFLKSQGIDTVSVVSADGSGLSRDNRVSAAVLARLLETMLRDHEHSEYYLDSLAVSGVRGSFRKRLKNLTGRVFAKTGTINGVSSLSGYVFADNGRIAAFSILHNGPAGGFRQQQDRAVQAISDWLNDQPGVAIEDPDVVEAMRHVGLLAEPVAE